MKLFSKLLLLFVSCIPYTIQAQMISATDGKYQYEYAKNDPTQTRIYTLNNGLKIYLSVNKDEPRVQTNIAVRTGSKNDPRENTGLAHYLEHMVFKGTSKIASSNWDEEKKLLQQISDLYEAHKRETDPTKKTRLYAQIDSVSSLAAKYAIPNEYDKMVTSLGAKGTNAYTSTDETVYVNDIPATEIEKWLFVESERFSQLVLRLFHTELEAVYEEYNMGKDRDRSKVYEATLSALFPQHPYGISTIGLGEHLKNPSMVAINNYFNQYYIPNNVAICMSGDIDPSQTIQLIDKYFGKWQTKLLATPNYQREADITQPITTTVVGKDAEFLNIAFRFDGANSEDSKFLPLMDGLLQNGQAGIMDLNLLQKQKILDGYTYLATMNDYSMFNLYGKPRQGQSVEEVQALLLEQIDLLKKGQFDDWLIKAVIKDFKLKQLKSNETNGGRAAAMVDAFITQTPWDKKTRELDELDKITKADVVDFVNRRFKNNYVVVYKKQGEDATATKIPKPQITPVALNREAQSDFAKQFEQMSEMRLKPEFLDFEKDIRHSTIDKIPYFYIKNEINPTFALYYVLDMGTNNNRKLGLATNYLQYLGTSKYSSEQLQQEFYKLGLNFDVSTQGDRMYVVLRGLEESLDEGVKLFEHLLADAQPNEEALQAVIDDVLKSRADAKKDKNRIFSALYNYGQYGSKSPVTNILSETELKAITAQELVDLIKSLNGYKHSIFYYGSKDAKTAAKIIKKYHKPPKNLQNYPATTIYTEQPTDKPRVFFANYDMVQSQIYLLSKGGTYNTALLPYAAMFGEYFGGGLSSIVFQEIRESRALAYSAFAYYDTPDRLDRSNYTGAFVGTQADKMKDATTAMRQLLVTMPRADKQFEGSRLSMLKQLESERITKARKFFSYLAAKDLGINYDTRKDTYAKVQTMTFDDLSNFYQQNIGGKNFIIMVMGNRDKLDMEYLKSLGDFKEVTLDEIFGY